MQHANWRLGNIVGLHQLLLVTQRDALQHIINIRLARIELSPADIESNACFTSDVRMTFGLVLVVPKLQDLI